MPVSDTLMHYVQTWANELQSHLHTRYDSLWLNTSFGKTHVWAAQTNTANKPDILFIPGWRACGLSWDIADQMQHYTPNYNVYLLDVIGQPGLSDHTPKRFRSYQYSLYMKEVTDLLHLDRLVVVGESFGGFLSFQLALAAPHKIEKAVLFAPAGWVNVTIDWRMMTNFVALTARPTPRTAGRFLKRILYNAQHPQLTSTTKKYMVDFMASAFRHSPLIPPPPPYVFSDQQLQSIQVKTLLIAGESDCLFSAVRTIERARRLLPNLDTAVLLPNADHALIIHPPAHEQVRAFLTK